MWLGIGMHKDFDCAETHSNPTGVHRLRLFIRIHQRLHRTSLATGRQGSEVEERFQ